MKLSIIIPNWLTNDGGKIVKESEAFWFLKNCVERIKRFTKDFELILVDNGSEIGSSWMEENSDKYIRNEKNMGFAVACNQGIAQAKGDFFILMNNDIFVWEGWSEALLKTFEDNKDCGLAMPALMKQANNAIEALKIEKIDLRMNFGKYGRGAEFGSCYMMKKELYDRMIETDGYFFDERFRTGFGEDRDVYRRVRLLGYETIRTHRARVFHQGNITIGKIKDRKHHTIPNRIYLQKLRENEVDGNRLTEKEKDILREDAQREYEEQER